MTYEIYKFFHVMGVILLVGNVTVTSVWKVLPTARQILQSSPLPSG